MKKLDIKKYGFDNKFAAEALGHPTLYAGRVISQFKGLYRVIAENGELMSEVSGKLRFDAKTSSDFPLSGIS